MVYEKKCRVYLMMVIQFKIKDVPRHMYKKFLKEAASRLCVIGGKGGQK